MYFADIASSLYFVLRICAGWGARSTMAENGVDGNVEKAAALSHQLSAMSSNLTSAEGEASEKEPRLPHP
jgi:hypothetical protein